MDSLSKEAFNIIAEFEELRGAGQLRKHLTHVITCEKLTVSSKCTSNNHPIRNRRMSATVLASEYGMRLKLRISWKLLSVNLSSTGLLLSRSIMNFQMSSLSASRSKWVSSASSAGSSVVRFPVL